MGTLVYGNHLSTDFDDRALMHLQVVIVAKLRRHEVFLFSWSDSAAMGSGRSSIWLAPSSILHFHFVGGRPPSLNPAWLAELTASGNSGTGLVFTPEPRG